MDHVFVKRRDRLLYLAAGLSITQGVVGAICGYGVAEVVISEGLGGSRYTVEAILGVLVVLLSLAQVALGFWLAQGATGTARQLARRLWATFAVSTTNGFLQATIIVSCLVVGPIVSDPDAYIRDTRAIALGIMCAPLAFVPSVATWWALRAVQRTLSPMPD